MRSKHVLDETSAKSLSPGDSVVVFNTESTYFYLKSPEYRQYALACSHIALDGAGLQFALRLLGLKVRRFHGPELLDCIIAHKHKWKIVLAGGAARNRELIANGKIDCFIDLPFSRNINDIASALSADLKIELNNAKPTVVLISLGLPKQETVADRLLLNQTLPAVEKNHMILVPIGAAVDFLTGHKRRGSAAWRKLGLEWLPRMVREPRMVIRVARSLYGLLLMCSSEISARHSFS